MASTKNHGSWLSTSGPLRLAAALLALGVSLGGATPAWADDAATLLADGKKLLKEGKVAEACPKLEESHKLAPSATSLYHMASCHEKQGKIATAWQEFIDTEAEARKAGNKPLQADAKARSARIELRVPRITVKVPAGVEGFALQVDGAAVEKSSLNQPMPIDPGEHKLTASAPGRKSWEQSVSIKAAQKKTVTVPAMAEDSSAPAAPAAPAAKPAAAKPKPSAAPPPEPEEPPPPVVTTHEAGRFVFDVGVGPTAMFGIIGGGSLSTIRSYDFEVKAQPGEFGLNEIVVCDNEVCEGLYDPSFGVVVGGQAFIGYALEEDLHVGARVFGGYRLLGFEGSSGIGGGGYILVGGPAAALNVDPVWLGISLVIGSVAQDAPVTGVRGQIPQQFVQYNNDQTEVDVDTSYKTPLPETEIVATLAFGGAIEISLPLSDSPGPDWTSGAWMLSAWPTVLGGLSGVVFAVPLTLGYRFY